MKKCVQFFALLVVAGVVLVGCASAPVAEQAAPAVSFDVLRGTAWLLAEVREGSSIIVIDRDRLAETGFNEAFTLRIGSELVTGLGAPNRYFAPFSAEGQSVAIGPVAGTLMAPLVEPEGLREHEYFTLLQNVNRWGLAGGILALHSMRNGSDVILIFTPAVI